MGLVGVILCLGAHFLVPWGASPRGGIRKEGQNSFDLRMSFSARERGGADALAVDLANHRRDRRVRVGIRGEVALLGCVGPFYRVAHILHLRSPSQTVTPTSEP